MNMIERIARVIAEEDQAQRGAARYDEIVLNSDFTRNFIQPRQSSSEGDDEHGPDRSIVGRRFRI